MRENEKATVVGTKKSRARMNEGKNGKRATKKAFVLANKRRKLLFFHL